MRMLERLEARNDQATVVLTKPATEDVPALARICFEAFRGIHDHHGFARDFPDVQTAQKVMELMVATPGVFGVSARHNGLLVGSNFLTIVDEVGGVGPITVDPRYQGNGIGRQLMEAVLDQAYERGLGQVRLLQDSFNTTSLSVYASLGFDVREPVGVLRAPIVSKPDPTVRPATPGELDHLGDLCAQLYKVNRRGELNLWSSIGIPILVRETGGSVRGYLLPGKLGHGVAETEDDAIALIGQLPNYSAPGTDLFFLPLRKTGFYRAALEAGCRLIKVMHLMTLGAYTPPEKCWMPSIMY